MSYETNQLIGWSLIVGGAVVSALLLLASRVRERHVTDYAARHHMGAPKYECYACEYGATGTQTCMPGRITCPDWQPLGSGRKPVIIGAKEVTDEL